MIGSFLRRALQHPLTRGLDLDDPKLTNLRRQVINEKPFLRLIYKEWYSRLLAVIPNSPQPILEIGAGAGFFGDVAPDAITSDITVQPWLTTSLDAMHLPFQGESLGAIVMNNVLHHLSSIQDFFSEATRCVTSGGKIAMIEPWNNAWSRFIYQNLQHEPFEPDARAWTLDGSAPLSIANGALPWILFERDEHEFFSRNPEWTLIKKEVFMPLRYLVSGGLTTRNLMPGWSFSTWAAVDRIIGRFGKNMGMFALLVLQKQ